jgi:hypothetical protein
MGAATGLAVFAWTTDFLANSDEFGAANQLVVPA